MARRMICKNCIWRKGKWCDYLKDDIKLDEEGCGKFSFEPSDGPVNKFYEMLEKNDIKANKEKILRDVNVKTAHDALMEEELNIEKRMREKRRRRDEQNKAQRRPTESSQPTE